MSSHSAHRRLNRARENETQKKKKKNCKTVFEEKMKKMHPRSEFELVNGSEFALPNCASALVRRRAQKSTREHLLHLTDDYLVTSCSIWRTETGKKVVNEIILHFLVNNI